MSDRSSVDLLPTTLVWDDSLLVGHGGIDNTHEEFVELVQALLTCTLADSSGPHEVNAVLLRLEEHLSFHFGMEEDLMRSTSFPATECHVAEHAAVADSVMAVRASIASGGVELSVAGELAQHLADWFPGHAAYLDASLSAWLSRRNHGASPVVVRRNILSRAVAATEPLKEHQ